MASLPTLSDDGIALTHFIVAADVERSARFYSDVLGGERGSGRGPDAEELHLVGRPRTVARHVTLREPTKDGVLVLHDVVVRPKVEVPERGLAVAEERLMSTA